MSGGIDPGGGVVGDVAVAVVTLGTGCVGLDAVGTEEGALRWLGGVSWKLRFN